MKPLCTLDLIGVTQTRNVHFMRDASGNILEDLTQLGPTSVGLTLRMPSGDIFEVLVDASVLKSLEADCNCTSSSSDPMPIRR
jgi:hypothetical protein